MQIKNVTQGSPEWLALRTNHNTASEASAMMGASPYKTRSQLLEEKHSGITEEVDAATQKRFDRGHQIEEQARPIAEKIIGDELFPATALDDNGELLASFDGITMLEDVAWECKTFNKAKAEEVAIGDIPAADFWQCVQQLYVSGAEKLLYTLSDGTEEGSVHCWLARERAADFFGELIAGWEQLNADLADYQPRKQEQAATATVTEDLPAVSVQVSGSLSIVDNFDRFETELRQFVEDRLIRDPKTDQDFADLDNQVKALKKAEDALDAAEAQLLAQVEAVDTAKRRKDMLHKLARDNRLMAEKLVKEQKKAIKLQIAQDAKQAVEEHGAKVQATLDGYTLPRVPTDFNEAMKGKRTITTLRDAADNEVARAKIAINEYADLIRANAKIIAEAGYEFLFADRQQLVTAEPAHLKTIVSARIAEHKEKERQKEEARREQIRKEEQAKAEREAQQKADAEKAAQQAQETPKPEPVAEQPAQVKSEPRGEHKAEETPFRPSDQDILRAIAAEFQVDVHTAAAWVLEMNQQELERVA
ncbi:lambda-exonuclease family protein [Alcanivorax sp.]|uniref:lambda-exonuclease family protein n=1 Tax=Alcanivorax sp. TaxID=1872427 RepID=UPI003BA9A51C